MGDVATLAYRLCLMLLAPIPVLIGFTIGGREAIGWGVMIAAVYLGARFIVFSALEQIRRAAIYLVAESGSVPEVFCRGALQGAFRQKE